jgi:hypothetical protein
MTRWPMRWSRGEEPADLGPVERALADLAQAVEYPQTPDLASAVRRRVAAQPVRRARPTWTRARVAVAVILLAALVLVAFPGPRAAVARLWDLFGVEIRRGEVPSSLAPAPSTSAGQQPGSTLGLGRLVTLEEAARLTGGPVPLPARLGRPDAVWYSQLGSGSVVSLVYEERPGLPRSTYSGVGLLLSVINDPQADVEMFFKKIEDGPGSGVDLKSFDDGGQLRYWLSGKPHALYTGYPGLDNGRLAGNTLLWRDAGRTYRMEAQVSRERALELARSIR